MPGPGGAPWYYTPAQLDSLSKVDYTYEEIPTAPIAAPDILSRRLSLLGAPAAAEKVKGKPAPRAKPTQTELLGANEGQLRVKGPATTMVKLDSGVRTKVARSLAAASDVALPDNIYLKVENVLGNFDASVITVYINLPENAAPVERRKYLAGNIALFGLRRASIKDGQHGGGGLSFVMDITHIIDELYLGIRLDVGSLRVSLLPRHELPGKADITVGRVSVYRQAH